MTESIDCCTILSGNHLVAVNPPSKTELEHLHSAIGLMVLHHRRFGYRNFVIEHFWRTEWELTDLMRRFDDPAVNCFLLTLPIEENLRGVERRQAARAIDERKFEHHTLVEKEAPSKDQDSERHSTSGRTCVTPVGAGPAKKDTEFVARSLVVIGALRVDVRSISPCDFA